MGGAPWLVKVYGNRVELAVGAQVFGTSSDKAVVKAATQAMQQDRAIQHAFKKHKPLSFTLNISGTVGLWGQ